jgi:S1-C subfamily serine protease
MTTILLVSAFTLLLPIGNAVYAQGEVLGDATAFTESQMNLLIAKPAVAQVTDIITGEMTIQASLANTLGAPEIAGMYYEFVVGFTGSGFFVTNDGYFITNGHVAKPDDDLIAYYACVQLAESIYYDAIIYAWEAAYGYTPSVDEVEDTFDYILDGTYGGDWDSLTWDLYATDYKGGNLKMDNVKRSNYIQTGSVSGTETIVKEYGKAATVVDTLYEGDFDSRDLALLKVDGSNFPTVELGSFENVQIGSEVFAIGYPAVVEEYTGLFTDVESELEPSITSGIVSAKKTLVDGTEAFQTDAAITHGNSGGPVIDLNGKVIGVATWGLGEEQGAESFNFLISVEQVNSLLNRNSVTPAKSSTTTKWEEALDDYSNKCYKNAKTKFEETKSLYADNVDIDEFIAKCQTAIDNGEDICGTNYTTWMIVGGVVCCVFGGGFVVLILLVVVVKKKKKGKGSSAGSEQEKKAVEVKNLK